MVHQLLTGYFEGAIVWLSSCQVTDIIVIGEFLIDIAKFVATIVER